MSIHDDMLPVNPNYKKVVIISGLNLGDAGEEIAEWYFDKIGEVFEVYETKSGNWGIVDDIGVAIIPRMIKKSNANVIP